MAVIFQGGNTPFVITLDDSFTGATGVSVTLFDGNGKTLKAWDQDDLTINGLVISAPMTQQESAKFTPGNDTLLVKWKTSTGEIKFAEDYSISVVARKDSGVVL